MLVRCCAGCCAVDVDAASCLSRDVCPRAVSVVAGAESPVRVHRRAARSVANGEPPDESHWLVMFGWVGVGVLLGWLVLDRCRSATKTTCDERAAARGARPRQALPDLR